MAEQNPAVPLDMLSDAGARAGRLLARAEADRSAVREISGGGDVADAVVRAMQRVLGEFEKPDHSSAGGNALTPGT